MKPTYNYVFSVAFSVVSPRKSEKLTPKQILDGLRARVAYLEKHPNEVIEACGMPDATYEFTEN